MNNEPEAADVEPGAALEQLRTECGLLRTQLDFEQSDAAALQRYLYLSIGIATGLAIALYMTLELRS